VGTRTWAVDGPVRGRQARRGRGARAGLLAETGLGRARGFFFFSLFLIPLFSFLVYMIPRCEINPIIC
jgi:hypothetical protein